MKIIGIITTKDRIDFFPKAIESAVSQTRKLDELLVVSDSTDENHEHEKVICHKYGATLIKDIYSRNYAGSLNTAIHKIISDGLFALRDYSDTYIAFLDDDDFWHSGYIEKCEKNIRHNEDFVISGIRFCSRDGNIDLSISKKVEIDDFLKGNPHIQGSNTFVKLQTLLKAGMFDENMPSATDRDLFVRLLLLNPSYVVVNEHLVCINNDLSRPRITNNYVIKLDGLRKFYYKYCGLMSEEVKEAFFNRAWERFKIDRKFIENYTPLEHCYEPPVYNKKYKNSLAIGFIATEYELGLRLLKQLTALQRENTKILVLVNFTNTVDEYENILKQSGYSYRLITHDGLTEDFNNNALAGIVTKKHIEKVPINDIAISRSLLQHYLYDYTEDGDIVWVIDDDMELCDLRMETGGPIRNPVDIDGAIEEYRNDYDAVIGNYALDAPLPALSTLRTSLLDYTYTKINALAGDKFFRLNGDYYYDLTEENNVHLETPLQVKNDTSLDFIFSGKAAARPLYSTGEEIPEVKSRGGNTFIFNRELLKIPNWSLQLNDKIGRRSDYFWVLLAKEQGYKLANIPFSILHNRKETAFDYKKEENKLLLDLIGSSFTKAIEIVGISSEASKKQEFAIEYNKAFTRRLTKYYTSYYRIIGLLQIIGGDNTYTKEFTTSKLNEFVKNAEYYIHKKSVISAFDSLKRNLHIQNCIQSQPCSKIEEELKTLFSITNLELLGLGNEGIAYTDRQFVFKWFFNKPNNRDFLKKQSFADCTELYAIETFEKDGNHIIRYKYEPSTEYTRGFSEQLADLIAFGKQQGFVFSNTKKQNFVVVRDQLKMIDYGQSIEPYTQEKFIRSIKRCYEMLHYPFLNEDEFKILIALHYGSEKAEAIDYGYKNFELIVQKRQKEEIHDSCICELLRSETKLKILDYGAGKCKIANILACDNEITVYDIDREILHNRAGNNVQIAESTASFAPDSFDVVLNNLTLCCTTNEDNVNIIKDITRLLKTGGRAIISICCPFFNDIERTELRVSGKYEQYHNAGIFKKQHRLGVIRQEFHRPIEYYESLLRRHGLEIQNIVECGGVNTETILPIVEYLAFDCVLTMKNTTLSDCTLLIKTNPMEHMAVYSSIRHITKQLEKGISFYERIAIVDANEKKDRARRYAEDNIEALLSELDRAKSNGLIDRIIIAKGTTETITSKYKKYFGLEASNPYAENGQGLFATLAGFDEVCTPIVFQTDSDILYKNNNTKEFLTALQKVHDAVTVSLSIAHQENGKDSYGNRTEVRNCFINLEKLYKLLPLPNSVEDNTLQLPWHRALDKKLAGIPGASVRLHNKDLFFIHPQNTQKNTANLIAYAMQSIEKNGLPKLQYNSVDLYGNPGEWLKKVNSTVVLYIRGFNTPNVKLKRLFDSIKRQTYQDFFIVYMDDASKNGSADYAKFVLENDTCFKEKSYIILNNTNVKGLANFVMIMKDVIINPDAVVINIDNDDCLTADKAIEQIVAEFNNGADITCGNCLRYDKPLREYKIYSFDKAWERGGDNIWLHPKCFRRKLFDYIDIENDLKIDGKFVNVNTDFAFMLPMIEHSEKNVFIKNTLYYFEPSMDNQNSNDEYEKENKEKIRDELLQKARRRYEKDDSGNR